MQEDLIYETNFWKVILVADQTYLGRSVVLLKRECGDLADLTHEETIDFLDSIVKKLERAFREEFGAVMFNWGCLMNNAYQKENPKPQVHWHFRPRYDKSVTVLNETFTDPNFGHHYERGVEKLVSAEVKKEIVNRIQSKLKP